MIYLGMEIGEYMSIDDYKDLPLLSDAPENIPLFIPNIPAGAIDEISTSTQNRFFPPGRDLNALLQDIALNSDSVLNSACK
jgi:hypothetical protein